MAAMDSGRTAEADYNLSDPIKSFVGVVRRIVLHPVRFFAELPKQGNFLNPLVFALICSEILAILRGVLIMLLVVGAGAQGGQRFLEGVSRLLGVEATLSLVAIGPIIIMPVLAPIGLLITTSILHVVVRLVVGAESPGIKATFRVPSYAAVTNLISWVPIISVLALLYSAYLQVVGIREMHETTTGKAVGVFLGYLITLIWGGVAVIGLVAHSSVGAIAGVLLIVGVVVVAVALKERC